MVVTKRPAREQTPERRAPEAAVHSSSKKSSAKQPEPASNRKTQNSQPSASKPKSGKKSSLEDSDYIKNNVFDVEELNDAAFESDDQKPHAKHVYQPRAVRPRDIQFKEEERRPEHPRGVNK